MKELVETLNRNHLTISSAESLTGGLFASTLVGTPNASKVYLGSIVSYANSIKETVLKIDSKIIEQHGVISDEVVQLMCKGAYDYFKTDIVVSFSGNAGPDVLENKPVGAIYTCIKFHDKYFVYYDILKGTRNQIRENIVKISSDRIIALINKKGD